MPEFVFDPGLGESYAETLSVKVNPNFKGDWYMKPKQKRSRDKYAYTAAHWAITEARFRNHHQSLDAAKAGDMIPLEKMLQLVTMDDVVKRRFLVKSHRAYIPRNGVYMTCYDGEGQESYRLLSRQMVIFVLERRKAWRMLQSRAGIDNADYRAQKELLAGIDSGTSTRETFLAATEEVDN